MILIEYNLLFYDFQDDVLHISIPYTHQINNVT